MYKYNVCSLDTFLGSIDRSVLKINKLLSTFHRSISNLSPVVLPSDTIGGGWVGLFGVD